MNNKYQKTAIDIVKQEWKCEIISCKYLGGGSFGRAFRIELDREPRVVVVKIYLADGLCQNEAEDLRLLGEAGAIKVPKIYLVKSKNDGCICDCICMEYIGGRDCLMLTPKYLFCPSKRRQFVEDATDAVIALHSHTSEKFGYARNPQFDSWQDFYRQYVDEIMLSAKKAYAEGKIQDRILSMAEVAYRNFDKIFDEKVERACLSHGDTNVMNMMADSKTLRLKAFIDPLNALYCDPDYDLYQLGALSGELLGMVKRYKQKCKVSDKCDLKVATYGIFCELNCYVKTGRYTGFIMNNAIKNLKKQLKMHDLY